MRRRRHSRKIFNEDRSIWRLTRVATPSKISGVQELLTCIWLASELRLNCSRPIINRQTHVWSTHAFNLSCSTSRWKEEVRAHLVIGVVRHKMSWKVRIATENAIHITCLSMNWMSNGRIRKTSAWRTRSRAQQQRKKMDHVNTAAVTSDKLPRCLSLNQPMQ